MHVAAKVGVLLLLLLGHVLGQCDSQESDDGGGPECSESQSQAAAYCENNNNATECWLVVIPDYHWQETVYRLNCSGHPAYVNKPAWQAFGQVIAYTVDGSEAYGAGTALNYVMFPRRVHQLRMRRYCLELLEAAAYRAFVFLVRLELRDSRVGALQQNTFEGLTALKELQLVRTEFGAMHPDALHWLADRLEQLDVRSCDGVNFRVAPLKALTKLHLADSEVVDLTEMILPIPASLMQLKVVHVRSYVTPSLFLGTGSGCYTPADLQHVVMVNCSLRYVYVQDLPALKLLNISGNGLVDGAIALRNLPVLERLFATHNKLTKLTARLFDVGPSLGFVDLSHNGIASVHGCAFGANHQIMRLVLLGNPLLALDPQFRLPAVPGPCHEDHELRPEATSATNSDSANVSEVRSLASIFDDWTVQDDAATFGGARPGAGKEGAGETVLLMLGISYLLASTTDW